MTKPISSFRTTGISKDYSSNYYYSYCKECERLFNKWNDNKKTTPFSSVENTIIEFMYNNWKTTFAIQKALWRNRRMVERQLNLLMDAWVIRRKVRIQITEYINTHKGEDKPYWWNEWEIALPPWQRPYFLTLQKWTH